VRHKLYAQEDKMDKTIFARIGAVCYVLWGLVHYQATYNVYSLGLSVSPGMVQGRLFQEALYLFAFATTGVVLAIVMNWRNSRIGFWLNALIIGVADVPFILFVLIPGYVPFWPGAAGPVLWIAAVFFTGVGQIHPTRVIYVSA
jgi:hypothetical protein